jgi:hypothetical protein
LGTNVADKKLDLLIQSYGQALRRFLSVGVIYGGYPGYYVNVPPSGEEYWRYYLDPNGLSNTPDTWDQSLSFNGLVQACEPLNDIPNNGFYQVIGQPPGPSTGPVSSLPLTLDALDNFIGHFRGANNGHIDCLVMNFELRQNYLQLWRSIGQLPEYIIDPVTGYQCLAHDGIPILVNDYIESYDSSGTNNANVNNPENVPDLIAPATPVTSLFAVVFGEDRGGVFGIYPQSFGSSPIKIEHSRSSEESDTIYLRGMVEAGLAFGSRRGVGRLAGIEIISGT